MNARRFRNACAIMLNLDFVDLVEAGVIATGNFDSGGSSWKRFNNEPFVFVLKLPDECLEKLCALIESRQPPHLKESS